MRSKFHNELLDPMKIFQIRLLCLLSALQLIGHQAFAGEIFVATNGSDQNPGTEASPVATLRHARDLSRQLKGESKRITIKPGIYYNVSVLLGPEDSGLEIKGASPSAVTLCGGMPIADWRPAKNGWLRAHLPPYPKIGLDFPTPSGTWEIRMLSVDGEWRPNSRIPRMGYLQSLNEWTIPWTSTAGGGWKEKPTKEDLTSLLFRLGDLPENVDWASAEVEVFHMWDTSESLVSQMAPSKHQLWLTPPLTSPAGAFGVHDYAVLNTPEGLGEPGSWFHDRTSEILVYHPRPGEITENIRVIAPVALSIIGIQGKPNHQVENIRIANLRLESATTKTGAGGPTESGRDGAISFTYASRVVLTNIFIENVAGWGFKGMASGQRIEVRNCTVRNAGAGGIHAGWAYDSQIDGNTVVTTGLRYPGAVAIEWSGSNGEIISNTIANCTYCGIWRQRGATGEIAWNCISNCMTTMRDGGAIYTSFATNDWIHHNFVTNVREPGGYGASGVYLDEQTIKSTVEYNFLTNTTWVIHGHMSADNVIRNNYFSAPQHLRIYFQNCTGWAFEKNVLSAPRYIRFENNAEPQTLKGNFAELPTDQIISTAFAARPSSTTNTLPEETIRKHARPGGAQTLGIKSFTTRGASYRGGEVSN